MLQDTDFPVYFKDQCHPEDFIPVLLRKNLFIIDYLQEYVFLTDENTYLPFTFILDT